MFHKLEFKVQWRLFPFKPLQKLVPFYSCSCMKWSEGRILLEIFLAFSSFPALDSIVNCEHEKISASSSNVELAENASFLLQSARYMSSCMKWVSIEHPMEKGKEDQITFFFLVTSRRRRRSSLVKRRKKRRINFFAPNPICLKPVEADKTLFSLEKVRVKQSSFPTHEYIR